MAAFKIVLLEHGYASSATERQYVESLGGEFIDGDAVGIEAALRECRNADGVLVRRMELTRELLESYFRGVKVIVRYGIGVDNIDAQAATELGIILSRLPGYCVEEVSDHAIAMMLALGRGIVDRHEAMRQGQWDVKRRMRVMRFRDATVGLVGFGQIGRTVARKLQGWQVKVLAYDPYIDPAIIKDAGVQAAGFQELLTGSDYVSLHVPMLPENYHMIGEAALGRMKPSGLLINTARGGLVDLAALQAALDKNLIHGAALDVFED